MKAEDGRWKSVFIQSLSAEGAACNCEFALNQAPVAIANSSYGTGLNVYKNSSLYICSRTAEELEFAEYPVFILCPEHGRDCHLVFF